jgi:hypothetical protein
MLLGRQFLRAALMLIFAGVTVVLALQGLSWRNAAQGLLYLAIFISTDLIAGAVLNRLARHDHEASRLKSDPGSPVGN